MPATLHKLAFWTPAPFQPWRRLGLAAVLALAVAAPTGLSTPALAQPDPGQAGSAAVVDGPGAAEFVPPSAGLPSVGPRSVGLRVVRPGDTLYAIARQHGTTVDTLMRINGLQPRDLLMPGSRLRVPLGQAVLTGAVEAQASPGLPPDPASPGHVLYEVQSGDTLYAIGLRFGVRPEALIESNGLAGETIAPGQVLRVPRPGMGSGGGGQRWIEVDISEQRLLAWEGERLVWNVPASTGLSGYPTRRGSFAVQSKIPMAWSSAWQLWMPKWLGIYWAGGSENGIHALPFRNGQQLWAGLLGAPASYGCIVIGPEAAERLFDWAPMGTPVQIHD